MTFNSQGNAVITLDFGEDSPHNGELIFRGARAFRRASIVFCTSLDLEGAYDTLVEIVDSEWLSEMQAIAESGHHSIPNLHHFAIFFDGWGAFEFLAEELEAPMLVPAFG